MLAAQYRGVGLPSRTMRRGAFPTPAVPRCQTLRGISTLPRPARLGPLRLPQRKWQQHGNNNVIPMAHSRIPEASGLLDPENNRDACGVGFVGGESFRQYHVRSDMYCMCSR